MTFSHVTEHEIWLVVVIKLVCGDLVNQWVEQCLLVLSSNRMGDSMQLYSRLNFDQGKLKRSLLTLSREAKTKSNTTVRKSALEWAQLID